MINHSSVDSIKLNEIICNILGYVPCKSWQPMNATSHFQSYQCEHQYCLPVDHFTNFSSNVGASWSILTKHNFNNVVTSHTLVAIKLTVTDDVFDISKRYELEVCAPDLQPHVVYGLNIQEVMCKMTIAIFISDFVQYKDKLKSWEVEKYQSWIDEFNWKRSTTEENELLYEIDMNGWFEKAAKKYKEECETNYQAVIDRIKKRKIYNK